MLINRLQGVLESSNEAEDAAGGVEGVLEADNADKGKVKKVPVQAFEKRIKLIRYSETHSN